MASTRPEPFSAPEAFVVPEGIGPVECVNVEHEEVMLVPRVIDCQKVTFKYALGADFIAILKTLHRLGLDSTKPIRVKGVEVAPRDVVAALTPDPATVGDRMFGRAIVGTWVIGRKDGQAREVYLYQKTVGEDCWRDLGLQAVGWQTGFNPVIAMEMLVRRLERCRGARPGVLPGRPYLTAMTAHGIHWALEEREPGVNRPT